MVRIMIEPPKGNAESAVDNWVQNYNKWDADPVDHTHAETNTKLDGSGVRYVRADYRFIQDTPATTMLDRLERRLKSFQGGLWYRIGYHVCDHDESDRDECSWDDIRESGTVPSEIPQFT